MVLVLVTLLLALAVRVSLGDVEARWEREGVGGALPRGRALVPKVALGWGGVVGGGRWPYGATIHERFFSGYGDHGDEGTSGLGAGREKFLSNFVKRCVNTKLAFFCLSN